MGAKLLSSFPSSLSSSSGSSSSRRAASIAVFALAAGCGGARAGAPPKEAQITRAPAPDPGARCAVWNRELSFAASVAAHDERAFAEHVHPRAMFVAGEKETTRGRDAIVAAWRPIVAGQPVILHWHPTAVVVEGDPNIAVSRGPYLIEDPRPDAVARFRKGIFQSVWVKDADGVWRVFVDGGTPPPVVATADEAAKIKAELHAPCDPAG